MNTRRIGSILGKRRHKCPGCGKKSALPICPKCATSTDPEIVALVEQALSNMRDDLAKQTGFTRATYSAPKYE